MEISPAASRRTEAVFNYLRSQIGQPTPRAVEVAAALRIPPSAVDNAVTYLRRHERIIASGTGNSRVIHFPGEGETIPRISRRGRAMLAVTEPVVEPVRVEHFSCPRCGVRNCTRHSAAFLTVGRVPSYMGA